MEDLEAMIQVEDLDAPIPTQSQCGYLAFNWASKSTGFGITSGSLHVRTGCGARTLWASEGKSRTSLVSFPPLPGCQHPGLQGAA